MNAQRIESSAGGNTNVVHVVRDLLTGVPTTTIGTVAEGTAGTKLYVSGIPYYDAGSPTATLLTELYLLKVYEPRIEP